MRWLCTCLTFGLAGACASTPASDRPLRSPTRDYPPPPAQTSDGEVVGADRRSPEDTLEMGPTHDGLAPGWSLDAGRPKYEPKNRVGGHTDHEGDHDHDHDHDDHHEHDAEHDHDRH